MLASSSKALAVLDNCHFEGIEQDLGSILTITQGSTFHLTSSTIISRTVYNPEWGSDRTRSLFHFDDGYDVS